MMMATARQRSGELAAHREEVGAAHGPEEDDRHEGEVGAVHDAGDEDLLELPAVGVRGRLHPVLGDGHDRACASIH